MKLLIVDDSFATRRLIINSLRMGGLKVSSVKEAGDGLEAMAAVGSEPPDLIVCDLNMPKLDGLKFIKMLRQKYDAKKVKIVLLTARASKPIEKMALDSGAQLVMDKPFDAEKLIKELKRLAPEET
jgi:CheY-like chemotaxis protein